MSARMPPGRLGGVAVGEAHLELARQLQQTAKEAIDPLLRQAPRYRQRKKHPQRLPSHGREITEPARQAAMPLMLSAV